MTGRSKGYAFVQYKRSEDAKMALEQMEGFELAGRTVRSSRYNVVLCLLMLSTVAGEHSPRERHDKIHSTRFPGRGRRYDVIFVTPT